MHKIARLISFIIIVIFVYLIITESAKDSKVNSDDNLSILKIENFSAANEIIPGKWDAVEKISSNLMAHNLLIFNKDGSVAFAQGSSIESAINLAKKGYIEGRWSIIENPDYLTSLIDEQRFLIEIDFGPDLIEVLRVEIDPKQHRMGRTSQDNDMLRESMGLFTLGGKIFYKQ